MSTPPDNDLSRLSREELEAEVRLLRARIPASESDQQAYLQIQPALLRDERVGIGIVDMEETFQFANRATHLIFGVPEGTMPGRNLRDFVSARQLDMIRQQTARRQRSLSDSYEVTIRRLDGSQRHLHVSAAPIESGEGEVEGAVGIFIDMTERERALRNLRDSEARLAALHKANPVATLVWRIGSTIRLESANNAAAELLGLPTLKRNLPIDNGLRSPAGLPDLLRRAAESHKPYEGDVDVIDAAGNAGFWHVRLVPLPRNRVLMVAEDVQERRTHARLQTTLREMAMALTRTHSPDEAINLCLEHVAELTQAGLVALYQWKPETDQYRLTHSWNMPEDWQERLSVLHPEAGNCRTAIEGNDVDYNLSELPADVAGEFPNVGLRAAPLWSGDRVVGVLYSGYLNRKSAPQLLAKPFRKVADQLTHILERLYDQARLQASEEKFRSIAENIPGAVYVYRYTRDGRRIDQFLGPGLEDIIGPERVGDGEDGHGDIDRIEDRAHPDDRAAANLVADQSESQGSMYDYRFRVRDLAGEYRWIRSIGRSRRLDDGTFLWQGVLLDVTEQTAAEQQLRQSERRYRLLADNTADVIFTVDRHLNLSYISPSASTMFRANHDSLLHMPLRAFLDTRGFRRALRARRRVQQQIEQDLADPRTLRDEYKLKRLDGSMFWAEIVTNPFTDDETELEGFVGVIRDISARKATEDALRESEERFRSIFETSPLGIADLNPADTRFQGVNDACVRMTGYTREELLGMRFYDLLELDDQRELALGEQATDRDPAAGGIERRLIRRDGVTIWVRSTSSTILHEDGTPQSTVLILEDISRRKQAEAAILSANRLEATATLAGGLAHDINNLMSGVMGYSELLELEHVHDPTARSMVRSITRSAREAGDLAQSMIAFSRQGKVREIPFNLNTAVREILEAQRHTLSPDITISVTLADSLELIAADPAQMRQMVLNILRNAIEAVDGGGEIEVTTWSESLPADNPFGMPAGAVTCLSVRDTGTGMSEHELQHVFEPFFSSKFVGRGMGMAAAYGIVRNHHGEISYDSAVGSGTTARVAIPSLADGERDDVTP